MTKDAKLLKLQKIIELSEILTGGLKFVAKPLGTQIVRLRVTAMTSESEGIKN